MSAFEIAPPSTGPEIHRALVDLENEITAYVEAIPLDEFLAPQGESWSPERHMRHLVKSVGAVAAAMKLPKLVLLLRFGRPRGAARSYDEVVATYQEALAAGAEARGRYLPSDIPADVEPEEWRDGVLARWRRASGALSGALERWSESALDRRQVPHPLLGAMTMREIVFFTLYHNAHHARRIDERRAEPHQG